MKYEILTLQDVQVIGMAKEIAFSNPSECPKFWSEYVERIVKPVYLEGKEPEGTALYPIKSGRWLKVHFEGGMAAFQQQFAMFHDEEGFQHSKEHFCCYRSDPERRPAIHP